MLLIARNHLGYVLISLVFITGAIIALLGVILLFATIIFSVVMFTSWHWKTYIAVGKPGWWILAFVLTEIVGYALVFIGAAANSSAIFILGVIITVIGIIIHLVLLGISAWSKSPDNQQIQTPTAY